MDTASYLADLVAQCHRNAEIADKKFESIQRSMVALYLAVIPWGLAVFLLYASAPE